MKDGPDEIEVKFYLHDPEGFLDRLTKMGHVIKRCALP